MLQTWLAGYTEKKVALAVSLLCVIVVIISVVRFFLLPSPVQTTTKEQQSEHVKILEKVEYTQILKKTVVKPVKEIPVLKEKKKMPIPKVKVIDKQATISTLPHGFYVQTGAFKVSSRAKSMIQRLKRWKPHMTVRNRYLHAVWIGPFTSRNLAKKAQATLLKEAKIQGFIIEH